MLEQRRPFKEWLKNPETQKIDRSKYTKIEILCLVKKKKTA